MCIHIWVCLVNTCLVNTWRGAGAILCGGRAGGKAKRGGEREAGGGQTQGEGWRVDAAIWPPPNARPKTEWPQFGPRGVLVQI